MLTRPLSCGFHGRMFCLVLSLGNCYCLSLFIGWNFCGFSANKHKIKIVVSHFLETDILMERRSRRLVQPHKTVLQATLAESAGSFIDQRPVFPFGLEPSLDCDKPVINVWYLRESVTFGTWTFHSWARKLSDLRHSYTNAKPAAPGREIWVVTVYPGSSQSFQGTLSFLVSETIALF